jgi:hypothetical protein
MKGFRQFVEQSEEQEKNIKATIAKLPKSHAALIKGYKVKWGCDNVLGNGDDAHIGLVNPKTRTITISAPYNYGREFTFLHEIAHKVYERFMTKELLEEWKKILKNTKEKMKQSPEELWCMAYANHFAKNKIVIHNHPEWDDFIKKCIKASQ